MIHRVGALKDVYRFLFLIYLFIHDISHTIKVKTILRHQINLTIFCANCNNIEVPIRYHRKLMDNDN